MKIRKFTRALSILVIALAFGLLIAPAREGMGDFGSFAGGSDYDRGGGSSSSSGGGWSSSGSDWGGSSSSWSNSDRDWNSNGSGMTLGGAVGSAVFSSMLMDEDDDLDVVEEIIIAAFILFILYQAFASVKKSKKGGRGVNIPKVTPRMDLRPMSQYQALDPNFDEAMFKAWIAKVYVQLQDAWQAKDIETVRPYLTDALFNQMENGLDSLRKRHYTNYVENIAVLGVDLQGFVQKGGLDCIVARVTTRITDYTLDDNTGKLVSGDRKREKFMEYDWELVRKSGVITGNVKEGQVKAATCPHCGAPIDRNASMKCPYCNSILTATSEEWTISNMQGISQRTK